METQNKSYIQLQIMLSGISERKATPFKPVARTTTNEDGTSTTTIPGVVTAKQKILKKNDLKARSILMMTLPSEHLLTFNKNKDAKSLFEAIEARFGGHSSTNDVNTANVHVSTGSTPVSTASTNNSTACLSDATVYAYLATQPNGSQVVHEDLEQIHEDDLDEMDLKWQLALLSMKARKFYQRTGKKIIINGSDTAGYDKKKVECFNCHKLGHFARECRNPRSEENRSRSQDSSRRTMNVEESSSKSMLAIDGTGFDWSYMAKWMLTTNLHVRLSLTQSYKKGLASVEEQLVFYKKNESMLCDQIAILKIDASFNESDINALKKLVERLKKEKEDNQFKIDNFENASKSLDQLIGNQISEDNKKGLGYNVVNKGASENVSKEVKKTSDAPIIEDWVSDCDEDETVVMVQKPVLNNVKKGTGQREVRPVWTNAMRVNHQKFSNSRRNFALTAVLTKSDLVPFSTARQSFLRTTAPVSAARNLNNKVNTAKVISVNLLKGKRMTSAVVEQGINVVKPTAYWAWRPKIKMINHVYKNTGSCISLATPGQTTTGYTLGSGEDSLKLIELMDLYTKLIDKVTILENALKQSKESHAQTLTILVQERFKDHPLEGHDLDLWGDLRMIFDLNEEDDIWLNQQYWELLRWKLHEYSGVHSLFLDGTSIQINMLVEKKYPLKKAVLEKMINLKLEAEEESTMAHELLKFIKSQIEEQIQQYEQFTILEEKSIDSGFARFNTIITSHEAVDESFSDKNYVRKFLRALHPKWRAKVTAIEESKDLSSLDELINKKESNDDETSISGSKDEEYATVSDREIEDEDKTNDETCLMAQSSNEVDLDSSYYSDNASFLYDDAMQIEYDNLCDVSLKSLTIIRS
ncbi:ribonuclease H-like domain-containing protein [Tanacetum coccineum]|uniref:Ribonuclease H-like domain-containing protein n=1 Tax=Tanacetum coccineum TaxID=301880 RepID=A0ABQ5EK22_9ASTR